MRALFYFSPPDVTELDQASLVCAIKSAWASPVGPEVHP